MDVWKYEIISGVEQDVSLIRFAHSWDVLVNTWNKFLISTYPCIILYIIVSINCNRYMEHCSFYFRKSKDTNLPTSFQQVCHLVWVIDTNIPYRSDADIVSYLKYGCIQITVNHLFLWYGLLYFSRINQS